MSQDRLRIGVVKLPLEAEAIGRAKAGADYFQKDTCWDMFDEIAVENYTKNCPSPFLLQIMFVLLISCWAVNFACGEVIFLS